MAAGPKVKISRALGIALTPKAARVMERRSFPPGQHGLARKKSPSTYKLQLLEKQRLKAMYDVPENQLRAYYDRATHSHESTGTALLSLLETRADAAIYRMGFARTIYAARQYVAHGHFSINGRRIYTASHPLRVNDVITVNEKSKTHAQIIDALTHSGSVVVPEYYEVNKVKMEGKLIAKPLRDQIPVKLQEQHVVEYYSR
jgi:small subunit ribosomal protein S4